MLPLFYCTFKTYHFHEYNTLEYCNRLYNYIPPIHLHNVNTSIYIHHGIHVLTLGLINIFQKFISKVISRVEYDIKNLKVFE